MEIITHVLTSEQPALRLDEDRKANARKNIGATGNVSKGEPAQNGAVEVDSDNNVVIRFPEGTDVSNKADKVSGDTNGHLAGLDAEGNLTDSEHTVDDFATAEQGTKADTAYQKPSTGIPKSDLASDVQTSLGLADTALQAHQDISGKANKSEMAITNVDGDATKKNIQLKNGLAQDVVVAHQDISGKAEKSEMSIDYVSGDATKKNIQLKDGLSQDVVVAHQDISGKAEKSEMSIDDVTGDDTKKTIQLKDGLSQDVVVAHQDISGKAEKSEMSITDGTGADADKVTIQLKDGTSTTVLKSHQDITVKADKVSGATNGNFAGLDANGNLTDSGSKASDFATAAQGAKADSAIQGISVNGTAVNPDANKNVAISIPKSVPDPSASNQMLFSVDGSTWVPMTWETISFNTVTIGGKQYTTATVGSQIWLVGNLDLTWDGLVPSEAGKAYLNEPRANYYSDDESTYGWNGKKYGLLYNWAAVRYMDEHTNTLFEGWHVPTSDEWNTLKQSLGASGAYELMTTTEWTAGNGSDLYGFSAVPSGIRGASPSYAYGGNGARANFWTKTHPGDSKIVATMWTMRGDTGAFYYDAGAFKDTQGSVRLVKDV